MVRGCRYVECVLLFDFLVLTERIQGDEMQGMRCQCRWHCPRIQC